jgi:hypothetical protein
MAVSQGLQAQHTYDMDPADYGNQMQLQHLTAFTLTNSQAKAQVQGLTVFSRLHHMHAALLASTLMTSCSCTHPASCPSSQMS